MEINRTPIKLNQQVALGDLQTRNINIMQDGSLRPLIYKDFIIEELNCTGKLTLTTYDNYPKNYPARLIWKALEPDQSQRFWEIEEYAHNNESMVIAADFEINREMWKILKEETGSKRPISCLLNVPVINERRLEYSAATSALSIYSNAENIIIYSYTWSLLEEPKESRLSRWEKAMGEKGRQFADDVDLGEILLTLNDEFIYNQFRLRCNLFGGIKF